MLCSAKTTLKHHGLQNISRGELVRSVDFLPDNILGTFLQNTSFLVRFTIVPLKPTDLWSRQNHTGTARSPSKLALLSQSCCVTQPGRFTSIALQDRIGPYAVYATPKSAALYCVSKANFYLWKVPKKSKQGNLNYVFLSVEWNKKRQLFVALKSSICYKGLFLFTWYTNCIEK